jgi:hypothetical protein
MGLKGRSCNPLNPKGGIYAELIILELGIKNQADIKSQRDELMVSLLIVNLKVL